MAEMKKSCSVKGCRKVSRIKGLCLQHYQNFRRNGLIEIDKKQVSKCSVVECDRPSSSKGFCHKHYIRFMNHGDPSFLKKRTPKYMGCSVDDCNKPHVAKGLCSMHYTRLKNNGDVNIVKDSHVWKKYQSLLENFESRFIKLDSESCWIWDYDLNKGGYGHLKASVDGKVKGFLAHRLSYSLYIDEIPKGLLVCHKCDNPSCVNPNHLFIGTHQDNCDDKINKNRHAKGVKSGKCKLTEEQVIEIKKRLSNNERVMDIYKEYNVDYTTINNIRLNRAWTHIKEKSC